MIRILAQYGVILLFVQMLFSCSNAENQSKQGHNGNESALSSNDNPANGIDKQTNNPSNDDVVIKEKLIVTFGDSLYAGYNLPAGEGLAPELERQLDAGGASIAVHNAGVSGDTTAAGLSRLTFVLDNLKRKPDLVMVGLGGNDMLRGVGYEQTQANLTAIMEELKKRNIKPMLTGMIAAPNLGRDYANNFNPIFPALAQKYNAPLDPFILDGVITNPQFMLPDGIHPTAEGVDIIAKRLAPMVAKALDQPYKN